MRLFIATEHDGDFGLFEHACGLHGFERIELDDQAALHIVDAGAGTDVAADAVGLEGAGLLEHGIHVADEQHALAAFAGLGAGMLGDEYAGALDLVHWSPLDIEAEVGQLGLHDVGDCAHPFEVVSAAVDVDEFLQHGVRSLLVGVDVGRW